MSELQENKKVKSYKERAHERGTSEEVKETPKQSPVDEITYTLSEDEIRDVKKKVRWYEAVDLALDITSLLAVYLIVHYFIFAPFIVSGASMEQTLHNKEVVLVNRLGYSPLYQSSTPNRGDVVVIKPPIPGSEYYIKRVIGLPGDTLSFTKYGVYLNGDLLKEEYTNCRDANQDIESFSIDKEECTYASYAHLGDIEVPAEHFFVMGDNRQHSADSRACFTGSTEKDCPEGTSRFVPRENVIGVASSVIWPFNRESILGRTNNILDSIWPIDNPRNLTQYKIGQ